MRRPRPLAWLLALSVSLTPALRADEKQPGDVHKGEVTKHSFDKSKIFPGTVRDYWVYVPKQYNPAKPACVMVFQDGAGYVKTNGEWRVPIVFDNLIARKELPVIIGVFINPGTIPSTDGKEPQK